VLAERQTHMAVILHDLTARAHRAERDYGFFNLDRRLVLPSCGGCEEREGFVAKRLDRPKRFAPDETQCRSESVGALAAKMAQRIPATKRVQHAADLPMVKRADSSLNFKT
jgi:hypothetical protein